MSEEREPLVFQLPLGPGSGLVVREEGGGILIRVAIDGSANDVAIDPVDAARLAGAMFDRAAEMIRARSN